MSVGDSAPLRTLESSSTPVGTIKSTENTESIKRFACEYCPKRFALNRTYKRHLQEKHMTKTYRCKICDQEFNNRQVLKEHCEQNHLEFRVPCGLCDKTFTTKSSLRLHNDTIHNGIRYLCPHCNNEFGQLGSLRRHIGTLHEGKELPPTENIKTVWPENSRHNMCQNNVRPVTERKPESMPKVVKQRKTQSKHQLQQHPLVSVQPSHNGLKSELHPLARKKTSTKRNRKPTQSNSPGPAFGLNHGMGLNLGLGLSPAHCFGLAMGISRVSGLPVKAASTAPVEEVEAHTYVGNKRAFSEDSVFDSDGTEGREESPFFCPSSLVLQKPMSKRICPAAEPEIGPSECAASAILMSMKA
mmetsp:Transcript_18023/g.31867  ORF Transcript_18023/g.31867 Transcript_18023/m.31867 type:complete len:357 (+) Transcript_18023:381-1451(+)|eukprot:CAMPEP_0184523914 /NCGR_PEP_ID=MMETSP0198_2-20121128/9182_1 /TAXON_ID=1112570 /ORGANISM="Thraustochytrium sp., Strain LLF1b" /LENGTH=356 /DNA_ID=CAMNT_0026915065 /DNA_START=520 /DNA_END=1590 /DNA_ORIENTATION=-